MDIPYESPSLEVILLQAEGSLCQFSNQGTEDVTRQAGPGYTDDDFE